MHKQHMNTRNFKFNYGSEKKTTESSEQERSSTPTDILVDIPILMTELGIKMSTSISSVGNHIFCFTTSIKLNFSLYL